MNFILSEEKITKIVVFFILFCTFILPTAELPIGENIYGAPKLLFIGIILILYLLTFKKFKWKELFFILLIIGMTIITKEYNYLMFITIVFLEKLIKNKETIKKYLLNSNILYICLAFTLFYSLLYFSWDNRLAHTSIREINQSGLSIFCLGILLLKKNKKIGIFTLAFGCLSYSRSYLLALFCLIFFSLKFIRKKLTIKKIEIFNYFNLTVITSVLLFVLGIIFINQYKMGNISTTQNSLNRILVFFDMSNFLRFTAVYYTLSILAQNPYMIFGGIPDEKFLELGIIEAARLGVPYKLTIPHNLFFSHLKLYGIFAIIEVLYTSSIIKKITDNNNFGIYIAIALYSIFLGSGFYSYWLYLSVFTLIMNEKEN